MWKAYVFWIFIGVKAKKGPLQKNQRPISLRNEKYQLAIKNSNISQTKSLRGTKMSLKLL